jgi:hypothetical protein
LPKPNDQRASKIVLHRVTDLHLDPKNPRLPEDLSKSEPGLLKYFYDNGVLEELAQSFLDNGFFEQEPLSVLARKPSGFTVVEGNRRLATLMILALTPNSTRHLHEVPSSAWEDRHAERGEGVGWPSIVHRRVQA